MSLRWHVHVPFRHVERYLPLLAERHWQPELALQAADLDGHEPDYFANIGARLVGAGLRVTVHAPFMDLNPGAVDPAVRDATRLRYRQTFEAAARLKADLIVFHPGYDPWHYGAQTRAWQEQALAFWPEFLQRADRDGITIALENIFDRSSRLLSWLVRTLDHPRFGHCFDIGHWQLYGTQELQPWLDNLGDRLVHLHLHDNRGRVDDHLPLGAGKIDFTPLWNHLRGLASLPSMTLEAHSIDDLERSVAVFDTIRLSLHRS
ncbi:MAG: sugar phosphate isomerase/epimerase [Deltaproteobacteria bacterium]|nr:MAG: sugar phosphate isomerase/epimerase [Deltaproteobacteria bacterium]